MLYLSDPNSIRVDIYPFDAVNSAPIGKLVGGLDTPTGKALNSLRTFYVALASQL